MMHRFQCQVHLSEMTMAWSGCTVMHGFEKIWRQYWSRGKEVVASRQALTTVQCPLNAVGCKEIPKMDETWDDNENCLKFQTILIVVKHDSNVN